MLTGQIQWNAYKPNTGEEATGGSREFSGQLASANQQVLGLKNQRG